ncbi:MAG: FixH family protein [Acidobacteriota bacterium]
MKRTKPSWLWPVLIVGLLVAGAGANVAFMLVAVSDPSSAAEPDYYSKALHWDEARLQEQRSQELGWNISLSTQNSGLVGGEIVAVMRDRSGRPLVDARVEIEAFHNARSGNRLNVTLSPAMTAGEYRVAVPRFKPGLWEFRVRVQRGEQVYTHTLQQDVGI